MARTDGWTSGESGFVKKKRRSRAVNPKSLKMLAGVAQGLSLAEAGRRAGYAHTSTSYKAFQRLKLLIPKRLDALGCPVDKVLMTVISKLGAMETKMGWHKGKLIDAVNVVDHDTQLRAADMILELCNATPDVVIGSKGTMVALELEDLTSLWPSLTPQLESECRKNWPLARTVISPLEWTRHWTKTKGKQDSKLALPWSARCGRLIFARYLHESYSTSSFTDEDDRQARSSRIDRASRTRLWLA